MTIDEWEHFFKPEVRSSGRVFVAQGKVSQSRPSDTEVQSYIRTSSPLKVTLKSESVESPVVLADCSCPQAKKGQLCKHIWAALLMAEEKNADFLESKTDLQKADSKATEPLRKDAPSAAFVESQAALKVKQADYRKQQYQKQKQRLKDIKQSKKKSAVAPEFPADVEEALDYFDRNGFPLRESLTAENVGFAMKKLARVFHPDVGGSHDEILELNRHAETLTNFTES